MAINLGDAIVNMVPKWAGLDQRAVDKQTAKLKGEVKVEADTRPFKIKAADAMGKVAGKAIAVPLKALTAPFLKNMDQESKDSARKMATNLVNGMQSRLASSKSLFQKIGLKVGKDVESGSAGSMKDAAKRSAQGFGNVLKGTLGAMGIANIIGGAIGGIKSIASGAFEEAQEAVKTGAQTEAVIKSTGGAAKVTADQVGALAEAISNKTAVDDEQIQAGANMMLTFTNVRNEVGKGKDIFNQSVQASQDMATALGVDTSKAAMQLGKALNDPIKGVTKLQRSGVTFTDAQKKQIAAYQETGQMAKAQAIILAEVNREFGGSAAAQATEADKMKVAWANTLENIGTTAAPVVNQVLGALNGTLMPFINRVLLPGFERFAGVISRNLGPVLNAIGTWVRANIVPALKLFGQWVLQNIVPALIKLGGFIRANVLPLLAQIGSLIVQEIVPRLGKLAAFLITNVFPVIGKLWKGVFKPVIEGILWAIKNLLLPVIDDLGRFIAQVWTRVIAPVLTKFSNFFSDKLVPAFRKGSDNIKSSWDSIRAGMAKPVNFVIETVYNNGIRKLVNAIIGLFGGSPLSAISGISVGGGGGGGQRNSVAMASGGILPGYTPGVDVHRFYSPTAGTLDLSGGETILRPEFTAAVGSRWVSQMNNAARTGGVAGVQRAMDHQAFKDGGVWGSIKGAGKKAWGAVKNGAEGLMEAFEWIGKAPGLVGDWKSALSKNLGGNAFSGYVRDAGRGAVDKAKQWIDVAAEKLGFGAGTGSPGNVASFQPGGRVRVGNATLDNTTWQKVQAAQRIAGVNFNITQGSYRPATSYSGTTHTGGGALDVVGGPLSTINSSLHKTGFASWVRSPSQGPWPWHVHALEIGNAALSAAAKGQVGSFLRGGTGLAGGYSTGVKSALPGWAMIDERGDEWVKFNGGESVLPAGTNPVPGPSRFVGSMRITNWEEGIVELAGNMVNEMDWRSQR